MALQKVLRISIILLLSILSACGGGSDSFGPDGSNGRHIADFMPNVDCDKPVLLNTSYVINGAPVLTEGRGGAINFTNTTLEATCYLIQGPLNIPESVQLTIPPNTVMMFDSTNAGLTVLGGSIIAKGTASAPIYFTGSGDLKNNWAGIRIYKRDINDIIFNFTVIEYAGSGFGGDPINSKAAFAIRHHGNNNGQEKGRLTFTNNVIRHTDQNSTYAFLAENFSYFQEFSRNTIYNNPVDPISITFNEVHFIENNNQFSYGGIDNISNKIVVSRPINNPSQNLDTSNSSSAYFTNNILWRKQTIPYLVKDNIRLTHTTLNIEAGAELQFEENTGISVENQDAVLSAIGTANSPITFTKADSAFNTSNNWQGIQFTNAGSFNNKLDFVNIYFAGGNNIQNANLILKSNSNVHVSNSNIKFSRLGYGIYLDDTSAYNNFSNNTISDNFKGAGLVAASSLRYLDTSSNYVDNTNNYIEVLSPNKGIGTAATMPGINAPYVFYDNFPINGKLTIEPGAILLFEEGKGITIKDNLTAEGTPSKPILFSSLTPLTGVQEYWKGLLFDDSQGTLNHVTVKYAGFTNLPSTQAAGIRLNSNSSKTSGSFVKINNTTVEDLSPNTYGMYVATGSTVIGSPGTNLFLGRGTCKESDGC